MIDFSNRVEEDGMYIQYGKVIVSDVIRSEKNVFKDEDYVHFLMVRKKTEEVEIYANGEKILSFQDTDKKFVLTKDYKKPERSGPEEIFRK